VEFCERHGIVGIGWSGVNPKIAASATRSALNQHVSEAYPDYKTAKQRGAATGQIYRFAQECHVGDFFLYYVPYRKQVVIARAVAGPIYRDFDLDDPNDIYHCWRVEIACPPISILDLYAPLRGKLLGPKMSFWEVGHFEEISRIIAGDSPSLVAAPDAELAKAYSTLRELLLQRAEALDHSDWEWLVVDYFKAQGAHVDERRVGKSIPIIDVEAVFDHGELGQEKWRIQVKRHQGKKIDWPAIERDLDHVGEDVNFCYVSVYGFTDEAHSRADDREVRVMEAADFAPFLMTGKIRDSLRAKLKIPAFVC
jgi:predicted Mrr-cat superfamily restriction endonuclease